MEKSFEDVVISSRVRLARNVDGLPYPPKLADDRALLVASKVYNAVSKLSSAQCADYNGEKIDAFELHRVASMSPIDGNVLREKHLISADLLESQYGAAIINDSETISIMINEEDHVREQCIMSGLNLTEAYSTINLVDDAISKEVKFSYDEKLGYLTSCPTNIGTGMRASAMMFLPGLSVTRNLEKCVNAVGRLNMTIRGVYGEGSDADGYLYQISNQKTLGISEQDILSSVQASIGHIADAELRARAELYDNDTIQTRDKIMRAWGIMCNAYTISSKEFMVLIALIKLGAYYGMIKISDSARLEKLMTEGQPANMLNISGKEKLTDEERGIFRAQYVSKVLKSINKKG